MLLLVDVGNTQTVIGVYEAAGGSGEYRAKWRISTNKVDTADDLCAKLMPLLHAVGIGVDAIRRAAIASVVPFLTVSWQHAIAKTWGIEAIVCTASAATAAGLFEADYPRPSEIGSDRVSDAIAARELFGCPVVVVDFGTATNIEVIDGAGRFVGGVIAPGITTGSQALFQNATQIAVTGVGVVDSVIGKSTAEAVKSGVVFGEVGRVDGLVERIFEEMGGACPVVATGGLVHTIGGLCRHITNICPELTLDGLRILSEHVEGQE